MTTPRRALRPAGPGPVLLDDVVQALAGSFTVEPGASRVVRRTRLDTFDGRLRGAGLALEQHSSATGDVLVLDRGDQPTLTASGGPSRWPAMGDSLPPGPLRDEVLAASTIRALMVQEQQTRRVRRVDLRNSDAKVVARLELDAAAGATAAECELVSVESLRGYEDEVRRTTRLLRGLGLRPVDEEAGPPAADTGTPADLSDRDAPATVLLGGMLGSYLAAMLENLPGLLADIDTEFLHDFRVAVRRTRSTLKLGRKVLPASHRSRWEPEFKWLGDLTTPVRDLDVYELDLPTMTRWLVAADPDDLAPFAAHVRRRRTAERRTLVRGLRSKRYTTLAAEWEAELDALVAEHGAAGARPVTAGELADRAITRAYRSVLRIGAAISADSPATDLHTLRKRCKELRYALEVFAPVVDKDARKRAVNDLKGLQDVLGRFQDSEVQRQSLRGFATEMMSDGTPAAAVLAMGELIGHLDSEQDRARQEFDGAFARFVRPASVRRLERLGGRR